ncbi:hypothetical protein DAPPUDRAFT_99526 [Daphnia pulex]|uniref:Uncharacterized protein n=1 Tax=Daphnia pulex TaxID=6669 RepID=E9G772_DAPPU|nr:hypothetical protein DAPPUDRAFT_99526 [Daphnia pulex]|eukprot:EFX84694.1 hypothetical protein DAPPUDRAFT_99526 [Daphnia pulex]
MRFRRRIALRFKTATKGRQQEQHLGRRGDEDEDEEEEVDPADGGKVVGTALGVKSRAGGTLATAGRSNSSCSRLDKCHHFIVETDKRGWGPLMTQQTKTGKKNVYFVAGSLAGIQTGMLLIRILSTSTRRELAEMG